jgi:hypothetical protein
MAATGFIFGKAELHDEKDKQVQHFIPPYGIK